jgi:hypothetical protein
MTTRLFHLGLLTVIVFPLLGSAFSATSMNTPGQVFFDRFRATCPADFSCIRQFDATLVDVDDDDDNNKDSLVWVAVYRSNNNKPSVFVRDEFLASMKEATTQTSVSLSPPNKDQEMFEPLPLNQKLETPVAIGRLRLSQDFHGKMVLDSLRCLLPKEDQDDSCDGGSEFNEALSVGVDALLLHHLLLQTQTQTSSSSSSSSATATSTSTNSDISFAKFEGAIRTKATLFSNKILEDRGFEPVEELSKDMATHVSRYNDCYEKYAERTVSHVSKHPGARDRALQIVALLGKLDPSLEIETHDVASTSVNDIDNGEADEEYDPWAGLSNFQCL